MKATQWIFSLVATTCFVAPDAAAAPTYSEQVAAIEKLKEGIERAEKLRPDQLDKVQVALDISDPRIDKALLRYQTATEKYASLAALQADPRSLEAALAEKSDAFLLVVRCYDSVIANQRVILKIRESVLRELVKPAE